MSEAKNNIIVIGGGAAGFFGAIACAEANPTKKVILLEKNRQLLAKVRISGGGRCNVTHACFDPILLVKNYPRGHQALRGPFTRFQPQDTIEWFKKRRVELKVEADGRMFPITDNSETIINCLTQSARNAGVDIRVESGIEQIVKENDAFVVTLSNGASLNCESILMAAGSSAKMYACLETLGHTIAPPVPSLFTFNVPDSPLLDISGVVVEKARVEIVGTDLVQTGPVLMTHWGFSGPAVLKLSAWGARILHEKGYKAEVEINWLPDLSQDALRAQLTNFKTANPAKQIATECPVELPKNLWKKILGIANLSVDLRWSYLSKVQHNALLDALQRCKFNIQGKSTYKDEFVTCGGVNLNEINFKTMESKKCPGLYFAGEIMDIDGVTGGFNFQNAWTTSWIAGHAMAAL